MCTEGAYLQWPIHTRRLGLPIISKGAQGTLYNKCAHTFDILDHGGQLLELHGIERRRGAD